MFHVAMYIPFSVDDAQQVRYLAGFFLADWEYPRRWSANAMLATTL